MKFEVTIKELDSGIYFSGVLNKKQINEYLEVLENILDEQSHESFFQCEVCSKKFVYIYTKNRHMADKHPENMID